MMITPIQAATLDSHTAQAGTYMGPAQWSLSPQLTFVAPCWTGIRLAALLPRVLLFPSLAHYGTVVRVELVVVVGSWLVSLLSLLFLLALEFSFCFFAVTGDTRPVNLLRQARVAGVAARRALSRTRGSGWAWNHHLPLLIIVCFPSAEFRSPVQVKSLFNYKPESQVLPINSNLDSLLHCSISQRLDEFWKTSSMRNSVSPFEARARERLPLFESIATMRSIAHARRNWCKQSNFRPQKPPNHSAIPKDGMDSLRGKPRQLLQTGN